jgi:phosphoserine phosphatase RsbU/P
VPEDGTVLIYTDGIIEARNPDDAEFGMERLIQVCSTRCGCDALLGAVMDAIRVWSSESDQADDITLVALAPSGGDGGRRVP